MMQNQSDKKPSKDSSFSRSKILRIITSALLAFGLWFYVISVERTETEQEYTGVEVVMDGEAVLEEIPEDIRPNRPVPPPMGAGRHRGE